MKTRSRSWAGEFSNSFVLAKLKLITNGRWLWTRTIGSTLVCEGADTALFVAIAFTGTLEPGMLLAVAVSNYVFKCGVEVLFTPITYAVVGKLKKAEGIDWFDRETDFNPFRFSLS